MIEERNTMKRRKHVDVLKIQDGTVFNVKMKRNVRKENSGMSSSFVASVRPEHFGMVLFAFGKFPAQMDKYLMVRTDVFALKILTGMANGVNSIIALEGKYGMGQDVFARKENILMVLFV